MRLVICMVRLSVFFVNERCAMVKCADCGFLAARLKNERVLVDAEESMRQKWDLPKGKNDKGQGIEVYEHDPICFVRVPNFRVESGVKLQATEAVTRERECDRFVLWQQGFTPKEHAEMIQEEARLRWQARREDADKEWRDQQEDKAAARHDEAMRVASRTSFVSALIGFVAALVAALAAVVLARILGAT
jgi:hypothetical protein